MAFPYLYLFAAIAGAFNAVADTLQHHFTISVFQNKNPHFWNPWTASQFARKIPFTKYKLDAWHIASSLEIISWALAAVTHRSMLPGIWELLLVGVVYNVVFNTLYNRVLVKS